MEAVLPSIFLSASFSAILLTVAFSICVQVDGEVTARHVERLVPLSIALFLKFSHG